MQTSYKKRAGVALLVSDKIDFKIKIVTNNEGHFNIKHQKDFIIHIYNRFSKFMKQKLIQELLETSIFSRSIMDIPTRQKTKKQTED